MVGRSCQLQRKREDLMGVSGTVDSLIKELISIYPLSCFSDISEPCFQMIISASSKAREASACFVFSEPKKKKGVGNGEGERRAPVSLILVVHY